MTGHHSEADANHHPTRAYQDTPLTYFQRMEVAVRELLIEKGILTADQVRRQVEDMDSRTPARGAAVVARAWSDPAFHRLLIADGNAAVEAMGFERGPYKLVVVENTRDVHNIIVCTLCSCYPRWLLGLPPDWYKSRNYRSRMVREPRAVLREFGLELPPDRRSAFMTRLRICATSSCRCAQSVQTSGKSLSLQPSSVEMRWWASLSAPRVERATV